MLRNTNKKLPVTFITTLGVAVIMTIAFVVVTLSYVEYRGRTQDYIEAMSTVATMNDSTGEIEVLNQIDEAEYVHKDYIKDVVAQFGSSIQLVQRFFDDEIVYYSKNRISYEPIDTTLALNELDFKNNITRLPNNTLDYQIDGVSYAIKGIDVSVHQEAIDWNKVKADGVEYAILRVGRRGYGTGEIGIDTQFIENIEGALEAGIHVGVYFFSQAITVSEAIEEADFVLDTIRGYDITYPVVFDLEEIFEDTARTDNLSQEMATKMTIAFCDRVAEAGYTPMVYGNINWFMESVDFAQLESYEKWFAQYFNQPFFPYDLGIWQYTATGKVEGIVGDVDINLSFKDYSNNGVSTLDKVVDDVIVVE